jgi:hypothetical protein
MSALECCVRVRMRVSHDVGLLGPRDCNQVVRRKEIALQICIELNGVPDYSRVERQ